MEFAVEHRTDSAAAIVDITGEIDVFSSPRLRESLLEIIESDSVHLVIDLADVTFVDSTGLGVLVGIYHRLRSRGGTMSFVGASERVTRVFNITQLTRIFTFYDSLDEALAAVPQHTP